MEWAAVSGTTSPTEPVGRDGPAVWFRICVPPEGDKRKVSAVSHSRLPSPERDAVYVYRKRRRESVAGTQSVARFTINLENLILDI